MNTIIISTLTCANVILVGFFYPLKKVDKQVIRRSQQVCKQTYNTCPNSITKVNDTRYQVLCR